MDKNINFEKIAELIDRVKQIKSEYLTLTNDEKEAYDAVMEDMIKEEEK